MPPPKIYLSRQYDTATHNRLTNRDLRRGGNFITQSYPTNFHEFCTRKILTSGDSVDNYREVTAAEKATIERADAKWEKPGDWLIEQAEANGAIYNAATGYFELNGLTDITAEQMEDILPWSLLCKSQLLNRDFAFDSTKCRTFPQIRGRGTGYNGSIQMAFIASGVEAISFHGSSFYNMAGLFRQCHNLHTVKNLKLRDVVGESYSTDKYLFQSCRALVNLEISRLDRSLWIADSPRLSMDSLEYMIINRGPNHFNDIITITLHPEAYVRVTDDIFTLATANNVTIATTA